MKHRKKQWNMMKNREKNMKNDEKQGEQKQGNMMKNRKNIRWKKEKTMTNDEKQRSNNET